MLFQTPRLSIRLLHASDADAFFDLVGDPNVMRFIKPPLPRAESDRELRRFIDYYDSERLFHMWSVEERDSGRVIGSCGVYRNDDHEYELAYRLRKTHWRQGFGSELLPALIEYCFQTYPCTALVAYVERDNYGSIRLLKRHMSFTNAFFSEKSQTHERRYRRYRHRPKAVSKKLLK